MFVSLLLLRAADNFTSPKPVLHLVREGQPRPVVRHEVQQFDKMMTRIRC
jgi:hypothetical protein